METISKYYSIKIKELSVYLNNERAIREDALPIIDGQLSSLPLPHNAADGVASHRTRHRHRLTRHHLQAGLAIKNPPKNPLKMFFLCIFLFFIFYENNTNFSL
jgi:hypothetical protein